VTRFDGEVLPTVKGENGAPQTSQRPRRPKYPRAGEERGWSQDELARRLQLAGWDVDRTLVARIELRTRCITDMELLALADTLGV